MYVIGKVNVHFTHTTKCRQGLLVNEIVSALKYAFKSPGRATPQMVLWCFGCFELQAPEKQQMREKLSLNSLACLNTDPPKKSSVKLSSLPGSFKSREWMPHPDKFCSTLISPTYSKGPFAVFHCS